MFHLRLPHFLLGLAAVAIIATAVVYTADRLGTKNTKQVVTTNVSANANVSNRDESGFIPANVVDSQEMLPGRLLYVKDGDVWVGTANGGFSMKLIDGDTISSAAYSTDLSRIAYTKSVPGTVIADGNDAPPSTVNRLELYVASSIGDRSLRVAEAVADWGWVPNSHVLWYEPATLQQIFGWAYFGTGDIFIVADTGDAPKKLIDEDGTWSVLRPRWDPTGQKVAYVRDRKDQPYTLTVTDRSTRKTLPLLEIPYIGGDRGGPAPIPQIWWAPDGKKIYTGFTTLGYGLVSSAARKKINYELGKLLVLEIDAKTGQSKQLVSAPSCEMGEESYPPLMFASDFSQVAYPRIREGVDTSSFQHGDYWSCQGSDTESYVLEDLTTHHVSTLMETVSRPSGVRVYGQVPSVFSKEGPIQIIQSQGDELYFLSSSSDRTEAAWKKPLGRIKKNVEKPGSIEVHDLRSFPNLQQLFFLISDVNSQALYRIGYGPYSSKVLDSVSAYEYYSENL